MTASVADHMLICATAFFTFTDSHKSVDACSVDINELVCKLCTASSKEFLLVSPFSF
jgi:hypothetical protein